MAIEAGFGSAAPPFFCYMHISLSLVIGKVALAY
ncbi:MAG: hypothetical protein ACI92B_002669 [Marinobacter maritimus]|jgi:hypothetical protein